MPDLGDRFLANLRGLALARLSDLGVQVVHDMDQCTVSDPDAWFSYRREAPGGRMAMVLWRA